MNRLPFAALSTLLAAATLSATSQQALHAQNKKNLPSMARPIKLVGIVAGQPMGREFYLRSNGQTFRVHPLDKVSLIGVQGGDSVRVWGRPTGLRVNFANVRVLVSRASTNPSDYNPAPGTTITNTGRPNSGGGPSRAGGGNGG